MKKKYGYDILEIEDLIVGVTLKIRPKEAMKRLNDEALIPCGWISSMDRFCGETIVLTEELLNQLKYNDSIFKRGIIDHNYSFSLAMFELAFPEEIKKKIKKTTTTKEKDGNTMLNKLFGKETLNAGEVALTIDGKLAVKKENGDFVRFNSETGGIENKLDLVLDDVQDIFIILPTTKLVKNDIFKMNGNFYHVVEIKEEKILAINLNDVTNEIFTKETTMFGDKFYSKVVNLMDTTNALDPMVMMMLMTKEEDGDDTMKEMMMLQMMQQNSGKAGAGTIDPMMLMMLSKNDDSSMKDILMLQMMQKNNSAAGTTSIDPMMLMMLSKDGSTSMKDMMLMQMMQQGNKDQAINPMMLMMLSKDGMDMKTLMLMQMMQNTTKAEVTE